MTIRELCDAIELQSEIKNEVISYYDSLDFEEALGKINEATGTDTNVQYTVQKVFEILAPDDKNIKMLTYMLHYALEAYDKYKQLEIADDIFIATMRCFTRFIGECYVKTGNYAFDRGWWTGRQVSMKLFRIGELEYEMTNWKSEPVISIHIPSDSDISHEKCVESIKQAKDFFIKYFPDYSNCRYICDSWLLSPTLKELLPDTSRIIGFQNMFDIVESKPDSESFIEWVYRINAFEFVPKENDAGEVEMVYQKKNINFDKLPEDTSLQKNIKSRIKAGGKIGDAFGILKTV